MVTPIYDDLARGDSPSTAASYNDDADHYRRGSPRDSMGYGHRPARSDPQNRGVYTDSEYGDRRGESHGRYYTPSESSYDRREGSRYQYRDRDRDRAHERQGGRYSDDDDSCDSRSGGRRYAAPYSPTGRDRDYGRYSRRESSAAPDYGYDSSPRGRNREYPPLSDDELDDYRNSQYERKRSRPAGTEPPPLPPPNFQGYPQGNGHGHHQQQQQPQYASQFHGSARPARRDDYEYPPPSEDDSDEYSRSYSGRKRSRPAGTEPPPLPPPNFEGYPQGNGHGRSHGSARPASRDDYEYPPSSEDDPDEYSRSYSGRKRSRPEGTEPPPLPPPDISGYPHGHGQHVPSAQGPQQQQHPSYSQAPAHIGGHDGQNSQYVPSTQGQGQQQHPSYSQGSHSGGHGKNPGQAQSQGQHGHATSAAGSAYGRAQSHSGGTGAHNAPQVSAVMQGCLQYARKKGFFDQMSKYMNVLPPSRDFRWGNCTGQKKAVLIGINYVGEKDELKGCANDARNMRDFLINIYNFDPSNIVLITDEREHHTQLRPTRREMFNAMAWLVNDAQPTIPSSSTTQVTEVSPPTLQAKRSMAWMKAIIFPVDYDDAGDIIDDELHQALVHTIPAGSRLTAVFDSCHSGTVLDLPYLHSAHGRLRSMSHISTRVRERGVAPSADIISLCACKDDETSADTREGGVAVGAMSYALIQSLRQNPHQTYDELLRNLREILIPKYHQKAQIAGTHPVDLDRQFTL